MIEAPIVLLSKKIGKEKIKTDKDTCFGASFDNTRISFLPEAVLFPSNEEDVSEILKIANQENVPITIRGAGTSTTGSACPNCGGWVISFAHWTKCEIDPISAIAIVQPGVVTQTINDLAKPFGLFFPADPASIKYCTIGGNIATNAGGLRAAKYGVTKDYVLELEGFLPTGEKVHWGAAVKKFVSGYNLKDLWIGSEGTLGIVTKAVLKLAILPKAKHTFLLAFKNDEDALNAVLEFQKCHIIPSVLEFLDILSVSCAEKRRGRRFFNDAGVDFSPAILLVEIDGTESEVIENFKVVDTWAKNSSVCYLETNDEDKSLQLWEARKTCSQAMFALAKSKLNEDVVLPLKNYIPFLRAVREISEKYKLKAPIFGHALDGNLHTHIMYNRDVPDECEQAKNAILDVMKSVVKLGGAITGEHGIGLAKTPFLSLQHSEIEIATMKAIKKILDPKNILGRGKIFNQFNIWDWVPVDVVLPWDKK